jgi:hypothetical protein
MGADVGAYVEPFAGSAAVLLRRPGGPTGIETINDADGMIANFWRAVAADPEAVARAMDWPVNECDLSARHLALVASRAALTERLQVDPRYFDAEAAAWWCWGACAWIGSGWCSGRGPWSTDGERWIDNRQLPHLGDAGRGINRKLPHLGNAGRGINRQLPHLGNAGQIAAWMAMLCARLRRVRVACGDWARVVTDSAAGTRDGQVAYFLDPPYMTGWDAETAYSAGSAGAALWPDVAAWARENGGDRRKRIVLCGHAGSWEAPRDWRELPWDARKGYAADGGELQRQERLWLSPGCLPINEERGVQEGLWARV